MARIYINVGKADGFYAGNLIDMLNKNVHGQRVDVGRIDLLLPILYSMSRKAMLTVWYRP